MRRFVETPVVPAEGAPIVYAGGLDGPQSGRGGEKVWEFLDRSLDHLLVALDWQLLESLISPLQFRAPNMR